MAIVQINRTGFPGGSSASGTSEAIVKSIVQPNHGFLVGNVLRWEASISSYILALADSETNAEIVGIVSSVSGLNDFSLLTSGYISSLSGLSSGQIYYLSDTISGQITTSEPTAENTVSKPLLVAVSSSAGYFFNFRGQINGGTLVYSAVDTITASSFSLSPYQEILLCNAVSGDIYLQLPDVSNFNGKMYTIKKTDSSSNTVSISGYSSGQTIDGNSFIVIETQYDSFSVVCDGSNWFIM